MPENGTWPNTQLDAPFGSGNLLDDKPLSEPCIDSLFEQKKVRDSIIATIDASLHDPKSTNRTLALFGRYGQGKSNIIGHLRRHYEDRDQWGVVHGKTVRGALGQVPVSIREFSVSNYDAEDLADNFDYFFEYRSVFILLSLSLVGLTIAVLVSLFIFSTLKLPENRLTGALGVAVLGLVVAASLSMLASLKLVWRDFLRAVRLGDYSTVKDFLKGVFASPDILIIDDVDRASTDQQKALFMSLRRHKSAIKGIVLVAFDEDPLMRAESEKPSPSEILDKTFDASFRLAPLNRRDAIDMALAFTKELLARNHECKYAKLIRHPMIVGDLARILYLHGNASARFAKKLLNTFYLDCRRMNLDNIHDMSGLLRVGGLFEYLPTLESNLDFLVQQLSLDQESELSEIVERRFGQELPIDRKQSLRVYMENTRHMKPAHGSWQRILRIWRGDDIKPAPSDALGWSNHLIEHWCRVDIFLALMPIFNQKRDFFWGKLENPTREVDDRELQHSAQEREKDAVQQSFQMDAKDIEVFKAMLLRIGINDPQLTHQLRDTDYNSILRDFETFSGVIDAPPLILALRSNRALPAFEIFRHHSHFGKIVHSDYLRINFQERTSVQIADHEAQTDLSFGARLRSSNIVNAWPDFLYGPIDEALRNFSELGRVAENYPEDQAICPRAHIKWLKSNLSSGCLDAVADALLSLAPCEGGTAQIGKWYATTIAQFFQSLRNEWQHTTRFHDVHFFEQLSSLVRTLNRRLFVHNNDLRVSWLLNISTLYLLENGHMETQWLEEFSAATEIPKPQKLEEASNFQWLMSYVRLANISSHHFEKLKTWHETNKGDLTDEMQEALSRLHHTVVLLHGLGCSTKSFARLKNELQKHPFYQVYVPDLNELTVEASSGADTLFESLASRISSDIKGAGNVTIVGHSMGGAIAASLAERLPKQMLRSVILIEGNLVDSDCDALSSAIADTNHRERITELIAQHTDSSDLAWRKWAKDAHNYDPKTLHVLAVALVRASKNDGLLKRFIRLCGEIDRTLYIHGDTMNKTTHPHLTDLKTAHVAGACHFVMQNKPAKTIKLIENCIWELPSPKQNA